MMRDKKDAEMALILNALAECVREMTVARWGAPEASPTLAEQEAREILAVYHGQFEELGDDA